MPMLLHFFPFHKKYVLETNCAKNISQVDLNNTLSDVNNMPV